MIKQGKGKEKKKKEFIEKAICLMWVTFIYIIYKKPSLLVQEQEHRVQIRCKKSSLLKITE